MLHYGALFFKDNVVPCSTINFDWQQKKKYIYIPNGYQPNMQAMAKWKKELRWLKSDACLPNTLRSGYGLYPSCEIMNVFFFHDTDCWIPSYTNLKAIIMRFNDGFERRKVNPSLMRKITTLFPLQQPPLPRPSSRNPIWTKPNERDFLVDISQFQWTFCRGCPSFLDKIQVASIGQFNGRKIAGEKVQI